MARRSHHQSELERVERTRAGRIWLGIAPALVFLILLIVFIAENGQNVEVSFFGATGHPPLAVALLIAAVAGAIVVLLAGSVRIVQLRRATRRHTRAGLAGSASASADHPQPVQAEDDPHSARP